MSETVSSNVKTPDEEALVKKGLYLYFDNVAKAAKEENDSLKRFHGVHDEFTKLILRHDGNNVVEMPLLEYELEDCQGHYHYMINIDQTFDFETVNEFCCCLAGQPMLSNKNMMLRSTHKLWLDSPHFDDPDTLVMKVVLTDDAFLIGTLEDCPGTLEEVREIVDSHHYHGFFAMIANEPLVPHVDRDSMAPLLGARLRLERLIIRGSLLQPTQDLVTAKTPAHAKELEKLSRAYPSHGGLQKAVALTFENEKVKMARDYKQKISLYNASGEFLSCNLMDGTARGSGLYPGDSGKPVPAWGIKIPEEGQKPILLSSLSGFSMTLAGVKASDRRWFGWRSDTFQFEGFFVVRETGFIPVETYFSYDDLRTYAKCYEDEDFEDRFYKTVMTDEYAIGHNVQFPEGVTELEGMTVKPTLILFGVDAVDARLKEFGIEIDWENIPDESDEEAESGGEEKQEAAGEN